MRAPVARSSTPSLRKEIRTPGETSENFRFAAAVAGFGQLLRHSEYIGDYSYEEVFSLARESRGEDRFGYRSEFLELVRLAGSLK